MIISAPAKKEDVTIVSGVNHETYDPAKHHIISNASCTTNCLVPVVKVILDRFGFVSGFMTTVHSLHQRPADPRPAAQGPAPRARGRAVDHPDHHRRGEGDLAGAPRAQGQDRRGVAPRPDARRVVRRPHRAPCEKTTRADEVNNAFREAAATGRSRVCSAVSDEPLVSVDYIGSLHSSTVDALSTNVVGGTLVNVTSWYDNEMGYSARCVDLLRYMGERL